MHARSVVARSCKRYRRWLPRDVLVHRYDLPTPLRRSPPGRGSRRPLIGLRWGRRTPLDLHALRRSAFGAGWSGTSFGIGLERPDFALGLCLGISLLRVF